KALYQRWKSEAKDARGDVGQFSKWLVAREYVTAAQMKSYLQRLEQDDTPIRTEPAPSPADPFDFGREPAKPPARKSKETGAANAAPEAADVDLVVVESAGF